MKASDIVDKLSAILPQHTGGFSTSVDIVSATAVGAVVTIVTATEHSLLEGDTVAINDVGTPVQIDTGTFLRTGSTATFETIQEHDFSLSEKDVAAGGKTITILDAVEPEFNGTFTLIKVPNRNKLIIDVDDSGPTTITGSPLVDDANGGIFNGLFPTFDVSPTAFSYTMALPYPLDGTTTDATAQTSIRIISVLDINQYLRDVYTEKAFGEDTIAVQLGDVTQSKSRNEQTDAATSSSGEYSYTPTLIQPFAVYVIMAATDNLVAATLRDKVEFEYVPAIFSSLLRAKFDTGFSYSGYRATFTGHGVFAYSDEVGKNKALYAHEITFEQLANITRVDTVGPDSDVAMRDMAYTLKTDIGTGELLANVNLDEDAETAP